MVSNGGGGGGEKIRRGGEDPSHKTKFVSDFSEQNASGVFWI